MDIELEILFKIFLLSKDNYFKNMPENKFL